MGRECLPNQEEPCQAPDGKENFIEHIDKKRSLFVNTFREHSQLKEASVECVGRQIDTHNHPSQRIVAPDTPKSVANSQRKEKSSEQEELQMAGLD